MGARVMFGVEFVEHAQSGGDILDRINFVEGAETMANLAKKIGRPWLAYDIEYAAKAEATAIEKATSNG